MNELQACQLEILKAFIEVCKTHNIRYFLSGGTALGAIRHQGFIPWDDDVDVIMPRPDYNKFINLDHPFKDQKYFIQTYKTDPNYIYNFAKIRDSSTTFVEKAFAHHQINHGVWIDVFPLDGMSYQKKASRTKLAWKVRGNWLRVYFLYFAAFKRKFSQKTLHWDILLNFLAILFFWVNIRHWNNKRMDKKAQKIPYEKASLVGNPFGNVPSKEVIPREVFGEGSPAIFEGLDVVVPADYDYYLTYKYGDYMKLPKESKQKGHHHHKGVSLKEDYRSYAHKHRL